MATLSTTVKTLLDWGKSIDPDGKTAKTIELLSQTNEMLTDMLFREGNLPTGHQATIRTGLPAVFYRLLNMGVPKSKSTTAQITETAAILEGRAECDKDVAELNGNVTAFRKDEDIAFNEAMTQQMQETVIYGSGANPEEFVGFANRYSDLSATNGQNILDAGGSGSDNMSVWFIGWGERTVHGVFPKGSSAGMQHEDLGLQDAFDSNNDRFRAYMSWWQWKNGLVVQDWRYAVRIANIDVSDLVGQTGTQALTASTQLIRLMSRSVDRLPSLSNVNTAFYMNRTAASHLRLVGLEKSSSAVTVEPALNQFGKTIFTTHFLGHPVRIVDRLTEAEAAVT